MTAGRAEEGPSVRVGAVTITPLVRRHVSVLPGGAGVVGHARPVAVVIEGDGPRRVVRLDHGQ